MATTVLVVEDDLEINELLGEYLALENIRYVKAITGGAGIHLAGAEHPDAIILDLMLPDVDGFEVAKQLTTHRATYDIPVIILSCMCQEADKEKGFDSGALYFMNKPFLPDDLLATVRQAVAWKMGLLAQAPEGTMWLGKGEHVLCAKGLHQMVADLFAHTDLDDAEVAKMREAMELLNQWAATGKAGAAGTQVGAGRVRVDYAIGPRAVTWTFSEERPGLLADTFFKMVRTGSGLGSGLMGWGGGRNVPVLLPAAWGELLNLTGAACFERDSGARTLRMTRLLEKGAKLAAVDGTVPVVEIERALASDVRSLTAAGNGSK